jgi:GAG-pre-integrase domain
VFKHGSSRLLGIDIHPNPNHIAVTAQKIDINTVHDNFGHPNVQVLSATAQKYGFNTKSSLQVCHSCAISKAKQKNMNQTTSHPSREIGGKINIDISSVLNSSYGGANFWLLIQDDFTGYLWSFFLKHKSALPSTMIEWLYLVKKELKLSIKTISLDNSGENMAFHKLIQFKPDFHIKFEFTAPGTPQQNGKVERAFATLLARLGPC